MRGNADNSGFISREELLELAQTPGKAQKALALFTTQEVSLSRNIRAQAASSASLSLLSAAVKRRQPEWTRSLTQERHVKRQRVSSSDTSDIVFAAKIAQSLVKTYATTSGTAVKAEAMDLACVALYVVCALEHTMRLGDLVVDNLLYQVTKKYAEMPDVSEFMEHRMLESASCVAMCVHIRLWTARSEPRKGTNEKELLMMTSERLGSDSAAQSNQVINNLEFVAELPPPESCHSAQFSRLLLGHAITCILLLSEAKNNEALLRLAENLLSSWILHLQRQDAKLASSFSDRLFRILWKIAAAVDTTKAKTDSANAALRCRSVALSFLLKCSNYTSFYYIQQVHRVGVQHEHATKRSQEGLNEVVRLYCQSANILSAVNLSSTHMYSSDSFQWEYIYWLEHFALICELLGMHLTSAMVLENAVRYVHLFKNSGRHIEFCLASSIAGALLSAAGSQKQDYDLPLCNIISASTVWKKLGTGEGRLIRDLVHNGSSNEWIGQCEKAAQIYLKNLDSLTPFELEPLDAKALFGLEQFMTRSIKRSVAKIFNYIVSAQHRADSQLHNQVITSFDNMCKAFKELCSAVGNSNMEMLIMEQFKLHRIALTLLVRGHLADILKAPESLSHALSHHIASLRGLLDSASERELIKLILLEVLHEIHLIARECYNCASFCFKKKNHQETISVLLGAFELGKSYLEYVTSSKLKTEDTCKAYTQLKMDAIASLLGHCFREIGNFPKSRLFIGFSIMYCGDILECIPQASVRKFVSCLLEEAKLLDNEAPSSILEESKTFMDNTTHVLESRLIPEDQMIMLWREFRDAFNRAAAKFIVSLQGKKCTTYNDTLNISSVKCVQLCCALELYVNGKLLKIKMKTVSSKSFDEVLQNVACALAQRNQLFCMFYDTRNVRNTMKGLFLVLQSLTHAAESLLDCTDAVSVDLGGIYGWRGVVTMEIALMMSYGGPFHDNLFSKDIIVSEENAIADIKRCLTYWGEKVPCGFLFDGLYAAQCLESLCNTMALISCAPLEIAARKLLKTLQLSDRSEMSVLSVLPSPLELLDVNCQDNVFHVQEKAADTCIHSDIQLLEKVDHELVAAKASQLGDSRGQVCQHLLNAMTTLVEIKQNVRLCQTAPVAKAIGMREVLAHTILSDSHFYEGQSKCAITEAKAALRVCWKMVKKFTVLSSPHEATYFELPPEIAKAEDRQQSTTSCLHFMALDCSSWDLLLGAKVLLCRLSSLYSLSDQPHRAALYLTEAMRLVGGLHLRFFRRSPFYEYAELELNASQLEKAKVAISLLNSNLDLHRSALAGSYHGCKKSDLAVVEQTCDEIVQNGDVYLDEDKRQEALTCYAAAIDMVDAAGDLQSFACKRLRRVKARCWRKITRLQSQTCNFLDHAAVDTLLGSMKKLKQSLKLCALPLERVKCMLELGRTNVKLLRSVSPRAFTSLDRTLSILEEAYLLGSRLCVSHLNQELQIALGMAYFAEIEDNAQNKVVDGDGDKRATFLSWASSAMLANGGSGDGAEKEQTCKDASSDKLTEEALKEQLERLAASPRAPQELTPHHFLARMAKNIAQKVQQLPDNWIIVSLMIGLSSELVVTRIPTDGSAPMSFCLPRVNWMKCIHKLASIVQDSRALLSGHTAEESSSWSTEQKRDWWSSRNHLDKRIKETIVSMQKMLGFWRCLLIKGCANESKLVQRCWSLLISKASNIKLTERNQSLLCAIATAQQYLSDSEVIDGLKHIAAEMKVPLSDAISRKVLQMLRGSAPQATRSNLVALSSDMITRMKVVEVKQLLAAEGLNTDGIKKVLVKRLLGARDAALINEMKPQMGRRGGDVGSTFATVLILHHQLQHFPWEGMDIMGLCSGVTRMPSLDLIVRNFSSLSPVRRGRVRYLLNPAGDLKATQTQLGPILERGVAMLGWKGIQEQIPDPDTIRDYLLAADVYIYCGHGSGEKYLHRDKVLDLNSNCSAALLFGCSSGRLECEGIFGPSGAVLSYLRAGSPAVLAMLWDVTDRDIDQLSCKVLQEWLLADTNASLAQVLQMSRSVCKLKYLNGHAAVCYGLPLHVAQN